MKFTGCVCEAVLREEQGTVCKVNPLLNRERKAEANGAVCQRDENMQACKVYLDLTVGPTFL